MRFLVTGATGFVGSALISKLVSDGIEVEAAVRRFSNALPDNIDQVVIGDLADLNTEALDSRLLKTHEVCSEDEHLKDGYRDSLRENLKDRLKKVDVVIHTAARVHVMREFKKDSLNEFRKINTQATLQLARIAADAGVKRFIFISTIGVNGAFTNGRQFSEQDEPAPHNNYALSKWEAEQGLQQLAKETGMEVVIIRPPLIYGSGAPGNFRTLVKWVKTGLPLPFAKINNRRSFLALDNLISFITLTLTHPKAANMTFLVADDPKLSTTTLLEAVASAFDVPPRLFYLPASLFYLISKLVRREHVFKQLWGTLEVDTFRARTLLGWQASVTLDQQLQKMAESELSNRA